MALKKLPARYAGLVMPFMLSVLMTCIISFVSTVLGVGLVPGLLQKWLRAWLVSWIVAFPTVLFVLPLVRKATAALVESP